MPHYLSDEELTRTAPAEVASFASPVPTQIVSNGEFNPLPQTRDQQRVEARIKELADGLGPRHGAATHGQALASIVAEDRRPPGAYIPNQMPRITEALGDGRCDHAAPGAIRGRDRHGKHQFVTADSSRRPVNCSQAAKNASWTVTSDAAG